MQFGRFRHKGLKMLRDDDNARGAYRRLWPTRCASCCLRSKQLTTLSRYRGFRAGSSTLKGDLKGFWSLTVGGNWRLMFSYEERTNTAYDLDLIDYH